MPTNIISIVRMDSTRGDANQNVLVALRNGEIKMFN